ncbi:MAG: class I SAM-dependent RNA methyltransferase [Candidatus Eremiobacterota bacterium]
MKLHCQATCAFGLEAPLTRELESLGLEEVRSDNGSVAFTGTPDDLCRANLWLRTADRVWVVLGQFEARTFEELFQGVRNLGWDELLPRNAAFPVEGMSHESQLSSVPACQAVTKKAIVECLKAKYRLQRFPEDGPAFKVRVALVKDRCTVSLDSSGSGLHRRGYRKLTAEAPLRETLAAGMVLLSYWNHERVLADPFCGSGTILVEAAWIGLNRAPGLNRDFACQDWPWVGAARLDRMRKEARDREQRQRRLQIFANDVDGEVLQLARYHVHASGLGKMGISLRRRAVADFANDAEYGVILTNPPYGERQQDRGSARELAAQLGRATERMSTWSIYCLTSDPEFERWFGRRAGKKRKLYNGMLACTYYQYPGPRPPAAAPPARLRVSR